MARQSHHPRASSTSLLDETNRPLTVITANADGFTGAATVSHPTIRQMDRGKIYWTMVSLDLMPNGSPQGERKRLDAGIEELDLEVAIGYGLGDRMS